MKPWKMYCSGLILAAGLAPAALAQGLPAITPPPGLAIAPQPPPVNAPVPPTALPPNIWDKILPREDQKAACKAKICNSPIGQMLNNMLRPAGSLTGGMLGPCCPTINAADLAKPADSAEGAAARLKLDEADAKGRREAVRYMAGADCRYWPEVTEALIGALRSDRNECVRLEAALALNRGCCCSRATMMALTLTVSGSQADGNPAEDSERVKEAALGALNHCLENYTEVVAVPEPAKVPIEPGHEPVAPKVEPVPMPMPKPPEAAVPGILNRPASVTEFYRHPENLQEKKVLDLARHAAQHVSPTAPSLPSPAGDHTLLGIFRNAMATSTEQVVPAAAVMEKPMISSPVTQVPFYAPKAPRVETVVPAAAPVEKPAPQTSIAPAFIPTTKAAVVEPSFAATTTTTEKPKPAAPAPAAPAIAPAAKPMTTAPAAATPGPVAPASFVAPATKGAIIPPTPAFVPSAAPTLANTANAAALINAMGTLRDSIYPEEREKAADALGASDGWANPNAVQALVEGARSDAAPIVRAACLHSLTRMNVHTLPAATVAQALKTDPDPRVRNEAQGLLKLATSAPTRAQ